MGRSQRPRRPPPPFLRPSSARRVRPVNHGPELVVANLRAQDRARVRGGHVSPGPPLLPHRADSHVSKGEPPLLAAALGGGSGDDEAEQRVVEAGAVYGSREGIGGQRDLFDRIAQRDEAVARAEAHDLSDCPREYEGVHRCERGQVPQDDRAIGGRGEEVAAVCRACDRGDAAIVRAAAAELHRADPLQARRNGIAPRPAGGLAPRAGGRLHLGQLPELNGAVLEPEEYRVR